LGQSKYQAHEGANSGGANAVYWVEIVAERPDGVVVVRNVTEGAKRKVEDVTADLEPDLLYPLLRGRDVQRWLAQPSLHILLTHLEGQRLNAIPEEEMQTRWPRTWTYLKRFEDVLWQRKSQAVRRLMEQGAFYSMFAVGDYTFAPWKVVWREVSSRFEPAVVGAAAGKVVVPDHTVVLISFDSENEAHYVCSLLASSLYVLAITSYFVLHPSPHVMNNVNVPRYDPTNAVHCRLAELSREAHGLAPAAYASDQAARAALRRVEQAVDEAAAALWGLSEAELRDIRRNLAELKGGAPETLEDNEA